MISTFLETFYEAITPDNDGSNGLYRADHEFNLTGSKNDSEAISAYLAQYSESPATLRTYSKETERFQMWCVLKKNKSITDLGIDDYKDYIEFLKSPDPSWVSAVKVPKTSSEWKPFTTILSEDKSQAVRNLSENAVTVAIASINSMLNWMVDAGYLRINPLKILRQKDKSIGKNKMTSDVVKVDRFLDDEMWDACTRVIESMPKESQSEKMHYERNIFIMTMFAMLGSRVSEMSSAKMGDFHKEVGGWFWHVLGKGHKVAKVAVPQDMINGLIRWRKFLGLKPIPSKTEDYAVIPAINKNGEPVFSRRPKSRNNQAKQSEHTDGLSARRINEVLKEIFQSAACDELLSEDKKIMLAKASAHWLRHTAVTQKIRAGMDHKFVQDDARHSDMKTTKGYTHDQEVARSNEAQKHRLRWAKDA